MRRSKRMVSLSLYLCVSEEEPLSPIEAAHRLVADFGVADSVLPFALSLVKRVGDFNVVSKMILDSKFLLFWRKCRWLAVQFYCILRFSCIWLYRYWFFIQECPARHHFWNFWWIFLVVLLLDCVLENHQMSLTSSIPSVIINSVIAVERDKWISSEKPVKARGWRGPKKRRNVQQFSYQVEKRKKENFFLN